MGMGLEAVLLPHTLDGGVADPDLFGQHSCPYLGAGVQRRLPDRLPASARPWALKPALPARWPSCRDRARTTARCAPAPPVFAAFSHSP
jgi:hypothetical protein